MTTPTKKTLPDGQEMRALVAQLEVRSKQADSGVRTVAGYAAVFDSETDIGGCWREVIAKGAFAASLRSADVIALYSHDNGRVIGRTKSGTLRLNEDQRGLHCEIDLPDTTDGRDLAVLIERGDVTGMSFRFVAKRQQWDEMVEPPLRTIQECDLIEVTITAFPAYPDAEVGLRSLEHARSERRQHNFSAAARRVAMKTTLDLRTRGIEE